MSRKWGEGIDLPTYGMRRALHVLHSHFGGSMMPGDFFISSCERRHFQDLGDYGLARRHGLVGWRITPKGIEVMRKAGIR